MTGRLKRILMFHELSHPGWADADNKGTLITAATSRRFDPVRLVALCWNCDRDLGSSATAEPTFTS
jgi:hypothetical protein